MRSLWLHLDRTDIRESLSDFPLLVSLDDQYVDRTLLRSDARDLRFYLDDQSLTYEIEDPGEPNKSPVIVWVKVPRLVGRGTALRMEYGGGEPAPAATESVWSPSYAAVLHLAETAGAPRDATGHFQEGMIAQVGAPGPVPAPGKISRGRAFERISRSAIQLDARELKYSPITISGWFYETALPTDFHALVSREHLDSHDNVFWLGDSAGSYRGELMRAAGTTYLGDDAPVSATLHTWTHLALTASTTDAMLFINGVLTFRAISIGDLPTPGNEHPIYIGADVNHSDGLPDDDLLDGMVDEVRIETVVRSPGWIRIDYLSMTNQLIRYEVITDPAGR